MMKVTTTTRIAAMPPTTGAATQARLLGCPAFWAAMRPDAVGLGA
jgi:hypothetical protein